MKQQKRGGHRPPSASIEAHEIFIKPTQTGFKPRVVAHLMAHHKGKAYPVWRYHESLQPVLVHDTSEDYEASLAGWQELNVPMTANPKMVNWRYDLEDFSARQLVHFAKEEFDIQLDEKAGKEKLFKAIWRLTMAAPSNKDRIVLMAQTMKMEYDATLDEIRRMVKNEEAEVIKEEFIA